MVLEPFANIDLRASKEETGLETTNHSSGAKQLSLASLTAVNYSDLATTLIVEEGKEEPTLSCPKDYGRRASVRRI